MDINETIESLRTLKVSAQEVFNVCENNRENAVIILDNIKLSSFNFVVDSAISHLIKLMKVNDAYNDWMTGDKGIY